MPLAEDIKHNLLTNTALPYHTFTSPVGRQPSYCAGSNILTSIKGYAEKRPGFDVYSSLFAGKSIKRLFTWQKNDGTYFIFASIYDATNHWCVYKKEIGTDSDFVLIWGSTDPDNDLPFDFVVANDRVFFGNKHELWWYGGDGTTVHPVGIWNPIENTTPTLDVTGAGTLSSVNGGYGYIVAYGGSATGSLSNVCWPAYTGEIVNKKVKITVPRTEDTQVDELHVYRTTDGGGGVYFEVENSPYTHTPGTGDMDVYDETEDEDLKSTRAPVWGINKRPNQDEGPVGLVWYSNRVWGFKDNILYWTGWEEVENGVEEECWPVDNQWAFQTKIYGLLSIQEALLVFTAKGIWVITGDSQDTFRRDVLFTLYGVNSQMNVTNQGKLAAWYDTSGTVHFTNGVTEQEISIPIRPDVKSGNQLTSSLVFHVSGEHKWLVLAANNKLYIFDLDTNQWMPPWTVDVSAMCSGETAAGVVNLFVATPTGYVLKMNPASYQDNGVGYTTSLTMNLVDIVPDANPGVVGELEYVGIERAGLALTDVKQLTDDDPAQGTFTSILANLSGPAFRTQGIYLTEEWYWSRSPAARRVSLKFDWGSDNSNFKLYSIDFAHKQASV